jgi:hypothetical protein
MSSKEQRFAIVTYYRLRSGSDGGEIHPLVPTN